MKTMKIFVALFVVGLMSSQIVNAGDRYLEAMEKNITALYASTDIAQYQEAVNVFDRIGQAEKTKWEPYYYSTFGNIQMAIKSTEAAKKDAYLNLAKTSLAKAVELSKDNSELIALDGFITMVSITVDPEGRGQDYSGVALGKYGKALAINPSNPRAMILQARMQYGIAQFMGMPATNACASAKAALELFSKEAATSPLAPKWGLELTKDLVGQCN